MTDLELREKIFYSNEVGVKKLTAERVVVKLNKC